MVRFAYHMLIYDKSSHVDAPLTKRISRSLFGLSILQALSLENLQRYPSHML